MLDFSYWKGMCMIIGVVIIKVAMLVSLAAYQIFGL